MIWGLQMVRQQRKLRPGLTTILASCRRPMSDSSSFLLQNGLPFRKSFMYHLWIVDWKCSSLSAGRRSSSLMVSSSIPRNTRRVEGPSRLGREQRGCGIYRSTKYKVEQASLLCGCYSEKIVKEMVKIWYTPLDSGPAKSNGDGIKNFGGWSAWSQAKGKHSVNV